MTRFRAIASCPLLPGCPQTDEDTGSTAEYLAVADFSHTEVFDPRLVEDADSESVVVTGSFGAGGSSLGQITYVTTGSDADTAWQTGDPVVTWTTEE